MRDLGWLITDKEKVLRNIKMVIPMRVIFTEENQMVKAFIDGLITILMRVSGIKD